jgi:hypothetical protein
MASVSQNFVTKMGCDLVRGYQRLDAVIAINPREAGLF